MIEQIFCAILFVQIPRICGCLFLKLQKNVAYPYIENPIEEPILQHVHSFLLLFYRTVVMDFRITDPHWSLFLERPSPLGPAPSSFLSASPSPSTSPPAVAGALRVSVGSSASPLASCSGFLSFSRLFVPSVFGEWCGACDGQPRRVGHLLHGCHGPKCMYTSSGRLEKISGRVSDLHIQLPKLKFVCGMVRGKIRSLCDRVLRCLISGARARRGGHVA